MLVAQNDTPEFVEVIAAGDEQGEPGARILYNTNQELNERLKAEDILPGMWRSSAACRRADHRDAHHYSRRLGDVYCVAVAVPVFRGRRMPGALRCVANAEMLVSTSVYPTSQGKILYSILVDGAGKSIPVRSDGSDPQRNLFDTLKARGAPQALDGLKEVLTDDEDGLGSFFA